MDTKKRWMYGVLVPVLGFIVLYLISIVTGSEFLTGSQVGLILGVSTFYWIMLLFFPKLFDRRR